MAIFRLAYGDHPASACPSGSRYYTRKAARKNHNGIIELVDIEEVDRFVEIQARRDGVDLGKIIARYRESGDPAVLKRRSGAYVDISSMPNNLHGADSWLDNLRMQFDSLGLDATFADVVSGSVNLADIVTKKEVTDNA